MKTLILYIIAIVATASSQEILFPHVAKLVAPRTEISFKDEFPLVYTLTAIPPGYYYIGIQSGKVEAVGEDHWTGFIRAGETKTVTFNVRLGKALYRDVSKDFLVSVGFFPSTEPIPEKKPLLFTESARITIRDYDSLQKVADPTLPKTEFVSKRYLDSVRAVRKAKNSREKAKGLQKKKDGGANLNGILNFGVEFKVGTVSYRIDKK